MKFFIAVCSVITTLFSANAYSVEFKFELPIDGEVKQDIFLEAADYAGVTLPWSSSFNHADKIGEDSTIYFPVEDYSSDSWPAVHLENNTYKEVILTNSISGHKASVYVRAKKAEIQFGTSNHHKSYSLEECRWYQASFQGLYRVSLPENGACRMPINRESTPGYGLIKNVPYGVEVKTLFMEMLLPKGKYFSGVYKSDSSFQYGSRGSGKIMTFADNPAFTVVDGEINYTIELSVPDRFSVEAETAHVKLQDRLNTWLTTGLAPKTLEAHTGVTFYSNREEFKFWYTCEFKTQNGKCAMKNEDNDTLELDVTFKAPNELGEISTIQNNNIEIDQVYESHVVNEMQSDRQWQRTYLGIKTSPGESERIYKNFPGSSYRGNLHIYIDAIQ